MRVVASVRRFVSAAAQSAEIDRFFAARVTSLPSFLRALAALRTKPLAFLGFAAFWAPRSIRLLALSNSWVIVVGIAWPWQTGVWRPAPRKMHCADSKPVTWV